MSGLVARDASIVALLPVARSIALDLARRLPPFVSLDDLTSEATVGLIQAVDSYDPSFQVPIKLFAKHRIRGAVLDYLRGLDGLGRSARKAVRDRGGAGPVHVVDVEIACSDDHSRFEGRRDVRALLMRAEVSPRRRDAIARALRGNSTRAIAEQMGISENAVRQLYRAVVRLLKPYVGR